MNADNNSLYPDLKVLIVEDNVVNQKVTTAMLRHFSITADIADNGQIGVDMAKSNQYDLILMDCQMPVMNGFDATVKLRMLDEKVDATKNDIPILAMTANASPEDTTRCITSGMNDVIAKPVELATLITILEKWIGPGENAGVDTTMTSKKKLDGGGESLDEKVVQELYELMGDDYTTVFDAFLDSLNEYLPRLREALAAEDMEQTATITHTLKGSSANIGANKFSHINKDLMEIARGGTLTGANKLLDELLAESNRVVDAIKNITQ